MSSGHSRDDRKPIRRERKGQYREARVSSHPAIPTTDPELIGRTVLDRASGLMYFDEQAP